MINLLRIDDRLLHGEVSFSWIDYLNLKRIIIINDEASQDDFTRMILELSKPKDVQLIILQLEHCEKELIKEYNRDENCIVIVGNSFDAQVIVNLMKKNNIFNTDINIGGLRNRPNSIQITDGIYFSKEDIRIINDFLEAGERVYVLRLPKDKKIKITRELIEQ
ncbi:MAG: PTS sugar transporter subunit IIB [Erysipelotrichia bacterium]|nr:PTS sugar transporter subunit IIB [Erysipelotrichia bacterium]